MNEKYVFNAEIFKALADKNRLMILDMLSCCDLCGCKLLEKFAITQPTLSHHMKILCDCGLIDSRKEGKWIYYSLNKETIESLKNFLNNITTVTDDCICKGECLCENK